MREILFKAKRLDNGEWVEGYICKHPSSVQVGECSPWYIHVPPVDPDDNGGVYNVDPETVCQYTGLTDKNRKKIFEGDRMETKYKDEDEAFVMKGTVVYIENSFMVLLDDGEILEDLDAIYLIQARVIGNIHDKENQDE